MMSVDQKKPEEHRKEMMGWLIATGHEKSYFDCGIGDADKGKGTYFRRDGLRNLDTDAVNHRIRFFSAANTSGVEGARRPLNIYISADVKTPQSWLMMDDLTLKQCLDVAGARTYMIVQTSPGRHHLWLATSRPVSVGERKACQQVLQQKLGGDAGSTSGDHFGRLAGFKNAKRKCWVNLMNAVITDRRTDVDKLLKLAVDMGLISVSDLSPKGGVCLVPQAVDLPFSQSDRHQAVSKSHTLNVSLVKFEFNSSGRDESRAEFAFACAHFEKNLDIEDGILKLAQRALNRNKRATFQSAEAYARKTFERASQAVKG